MIEILLILHLAALAMLFRSISALVGRIIALTYLTYMFAFTVLKPALLYYYDLYFPYSTNDASAVQDMLFGSLLFLAIQWMGTKVLSFWKAPKFALVCYDFDRANPHGIAISFAILMVISFIGCSLKFGGMSYLFMQLDSFEATMNLADGSWFLNYIAEILFYGLLMVVSYFYWRLPMVRSIFMLVISLLITYLWVKLVARTGALVVIVAWMGCFFSLEKQRRINILYIGAAGYLMLILLYIGNLVRLGNSASIDLSTAIFGALFSAASDLSPIDNSALLYSEMYKHASTNFIYILGSITPLVLIPSSLFPLKPAADKDAELTRIFFPDGADTTFYHAGSTLTFTVPGSGYADGGYFGVAIASVLYVLLFCFYVWIFRQGSKSSKYIASYLMIVHIVGFRLSIETLLISFYTSLLFFWVVKKLALLGGTIWPMAVSQPSA